jgi:hypothetical protein
MTAFGYGKPENFSGYLPRYSTGMYDFDGAHQISGYIFDTTSKYIKVPRSYYEKVEGDDYEVRFFRQFGLNISESPI